MVPTLRGCRSAVPPMRRMVQSPRQIDTDVGMGTKWLTDDTNLN